MAAAPSPTPINRSAPRERPPVSSGAADARNRLMLCGRARDGRIPNGSGPLGSPSTLGWGGSTGVGSGSMTALLKDPRAARPRAPAATRFVVKKTGKPNAVPRHPPHPLGRVGGGRTAAPGLPTGGPRLARAAVWRVPARGERRRTVCEWHLRGARGRSFTMQVRRRQWARRVRFDEVRREVAERIARVAGEIPKPEIDALI